nr:HK97 family phage prohead protease [uncultured Trichococcus sp.]
MNKNMTNSKLPGTQIGVIAREDQNGNKFIEGYFALFNTEMEIKSGVDGMIEKGAFLRSLKYDIPAYLNNNYQFTIGSTKEGTLQLKEDGFGLWGSIKLNESNPDAMYLYEMVQRGEAGQCIYSCSYDVKDPDFGIKEKSSVIKEIMLYSVSVYTFQLEE